MDDQPRVRDLMRVVLTSQPVFVIVREVGDGEAAVVAVEDLRPDVVIMDVELPVLGGLEAARRIRGRFPQTQVVMLSTHEHPHYVTESFQVGAAAYVVKRAMGRDLIVAVEAANRAERYVSPTIPAAMRESAASPASRVQN